MNRPQIFRYLCDEIITGHLRAVKSIFSSGQRDGWQRVHRARRIARRLDFDKRSLPQL